MTLNLDPTLLWISLSVFLLVLVLIYRTVRPTGGKDILLVGCVLVLLYVIADLRAEELGSDSCQDKPNTMEVVP